jgi:hypothetical protein
MRAVPCEDAPGAGCPECLGTWRRTMPIRCELCPMVNGLFLVAGRFYCGPDASILRRKLGL